MLAAVVLVFVLARPAADSVLIPFEAQSMAPDTGSRIGTSGFVLAIKPRTLDLLLVSLLVLVDPPVWTSAPLFPLRPQHIEPERIGSKAALPAIGFIYLLAACIAQRPCLKRDAATRRCRQSGKGAVSSGAWYQRMGMRR